MVEQIRRMVGCSAHIIVAKSTLRWQIVTCQLS